MIRPKPIHIDKVTPTNHSARSIYSKGYFCYHDFGSSDIMKFANGKNPKVDLNSDIALKAFPIIRMLFEERGQAFITTELICTEASKLGFEIDRKTGHLAHFLGELHAIGMLEISGRGKKEMLYFLHFVVANKGINWFIGGNEYVINKKKTHKGFLDK